MFHLEHMRISYTVLMAAEDTFPALSVVIPAFNEEARIKKTLRSVSEYIEELPYASEVLVIDDGSSDKTSEVVLSERATMPYLKLLRFKRNLGKGWAVREGMLNSIGRYRLFMDADGSTDVAHWRDMKTALDKGADVAVGSRHAPGSLIRVRQAPHREMLGQVFRYLVRGIFQMPINDTQNGFKAFRAEAAARIFGRQKVSGWAFDVEVLSIAKALKYEIVEVPITWVDDDRSRMTFSAMPRMLSDLMRIRMNAIQQRPTYSMHETPQLVRLA